MRITQPLIRLLQLQFNAMITLLANGSMAQRARGAAVADSHCLPGEAASGSGVKGRIGYTVESVIREVKRRTGRPMALAHLRAIVTLSRGELLQFGWCPDTSSLILIQQFKSAGGAVHQFNRMLKPYSDLLTIESGTEVAIPRSRKRKRGAVEDGHTVASLNLELIEIPVEGTWNGELQTTPPRRIADAATTTKITTTATSVAEEGHKDVQHNSLPSQESILATATLNRNTAHFLSMLLSEEALDEIERDDRLRRRRKEIEREMEYCRILSQCGPCAKTISSYVAIVHTMSFIHLHSPLLTLHCKIKHHVHAGTDGNAALGASRPGAGAVHNTEPIQGRCSPAAERAAAEMSDLVLRDRSLGQ